MVCKECGLCRFTQNLIAIVKTILKNLMFVPNIIILIDNQITIYNLLTQYTQKIILIKASIWTNLEPKLHGTDFLSKKAIFCSLTIHVVLTNNTSISESCNKNKQCRLVINYIYENVCIELIVVPFLRPVMK